MPDLFDTSPGPGPQSTHTNPHLVLVGQQCISQDHESCHLLIGTHHPVQLGGTLGVGCGGGGGGGETYRNKTCVLVIVAGKRRKGVLLQAHSSGCGLGQGQEGSSSPQAQRQLLFPLCCTLLCCSPAGAAQSV